MTISVCMCCKKTLGTAEDGRDTTVESHGCCLPCAKKNYPEAYEFMKKRQEERERLEMIADAMALR